VSYFCCSSILIKFLLIIFIGSCTSLQAHLVQQPCLKKFHPVSFQQPLYCSFLTSTFLPIAKLNYLIANKLSQPLYPPNRVPTSNFSLRYPPWKTLLFISTSSSLHCPNNFILFWQPPCAWDPLANLLLQREQLKQFSYR
jgi:hypothetical protein